VQTLPFNNFRCVYS
jgi:hypothetical protein